jgi:hypothetical protein
MQVFSRKLGVEGPEGGPHGQLMGDRLLVKGLMDDR